MPFPSAGVTINSALSPLGGHFLSLTVHPSSFPGALHLLAVKRLLPGSQEGLLPRT